MFFVLIDILTHILGAIILLVSIYLGTTMTSYNEMFLQVLHIPSLILVFLGMVGILLATASLREITTLLRIFFRKSAGLCISQNMYAEDHLEELANNFYRGAGQNLTQNIDSNRMPDPWKIIFTHAEAKVDLAQTKVILQEELSHAREEGASSGRLLDMLMGNAPALGLMGTVIGLIKLLSNLSDYSSIGPNMALALATTLYGVFASMLLIPPLRLIERKTKTRVASYRLAILWIQHVIDQKPSFLLSKGELG